MFLMRFFVFLFFNGRGNQGSSRLMQIHFVGFNGGEIKAVPDSSTDANSRGAMGTSMYGLIYLIFLII
jgi:hypothetical protein